MKRVLVYVLSFPTVRVALAKLLGRAIRIAPRTMLLFCQATGKIEPMSYIQFLFDDDPGPIGGHYWFKCTRDYDFNKEGIPTDAIVRGPFRTKDEAIHDVDLYENGVITPGFVPSIETIRGR